LSFRKAVRDLAGPHKFCLLNLPDGRLALCCGRFESRESRELDQLLQRFRNHRERGSEVFPAAAVISFSE
ncbi:MAG: hypothetical protein ACYTFZ_08910, partial [Planctomycetota bacterium]|jgi:hypothetical protein